MRRALKIVLLTVATLILLPVIALILVASTETGTRFAFERARNYLPEAVRLGRVEGRLADRLIVHDIEVQTDTARLELARVELQWTPSSLAARRLVIRDLLATNLRIVVLPVEEAPGPSEPFALPERIELPLDIALERAGISNIQFFSAPEAEPIAIDALELTGTFADARLELRRLAVRSPLLGVEAAAGITAAGAYPVAGHLDWTLRAPDYPEVSGTTELDGTLAELRITASARVENLDPTALQAAQPFTSVSLDARVQGPLDALELEAELTADGLEQGTVDAVIAALVQPDAVLIRELVLSQPTHDGRLEAAGRLSFEQGVAADLQVAWQRLQWPLDDEPVVNSPRGELRFTGPLDDYRLNLTADLRVPEQPPASLELTGEGSLEAIALELRALTPSGRVTGRADLRWAPTVEASIELAGQDIDPETFVAGWPGRIGFEVAAEGRMDGDAIDVQVLRIDAAGVLRGEALALEGHGAYQQRSGDGAEALAAHSVDIDDLSVTLGDIRLDVDGRIAEAADLRWRVDAPDLSGLLPTARGSLSGTGTVTGSLPRPRIQAQLEGAELGYTDYGIGQIDISADVDLAGGAASSLSVDARSGRAAELLLERLQVHGSGTPDSHQISVRLQSSDGDADADLEGQLEEPSDAQPIWRFRLTDARLAYPELAPWHLNEPAEGRIGTDRASVSRHCWVSDEARLCLAGERTPTSLGLDFDLSGLAFAYFAQLMPDGYGMNGDVNAAGSLRQENGAPLTGEMELTTSAGEFVFAARTEGAPPEVTRLRLEPSRAHLALLPHEATAELTLVAEHGHVRLTARLPDTAGAETPLRERPLSGALGVDVPDLAFVAGIVPDLEEVGGALVGNLDLGGTLANPTLTGRVAVQQGLARIPAAGVTLTNVGVDIEGSGGDGIALSASAESGGGTLSLTGELGLLSEVPRADLRLRGEAFQLANTAEARAFISPDLTITAGAEQIDVTGTVRIPNAEITPGTRPAAAVTPSDDQVLLSTEEEGAAPETVRPFLARVRIILGDAVSFDGFGLTARFEGDVLAVQAPGAPTTATGELNIIDGEYRAYGQGLVIESGNLYFAGGPVTEPALDIRAVRRPQEGILVGAHIVGTLEEPEFTLFSEPSMSQQEQLSYLVLGRSLQEAPSGESSALSQAALAMGLRGGDFLARNIGERLGVDQFAIETGSGEAGAASDPTQAALVIGKYLSPRLYVSYGIGLFDPINVLRMQYAVSERWQLVTQSSSESTGADILYTIERGR